jgi:hypothetical protein
MGAQGMSMSPGGLTGPAPGNGRGANREGAKQLLQTSTTEVLMVVEQSPDRRVLADQLPEDPHSAKDAVTVPRQTPADLTLDPNRPAAFAAARRRALLEAIEQLHP